MQKPFSSKDFGCYRQKRVRMSNSGGVEKIGKSWFYSLGGFANPDLFRRANSNGTWSYFKDNRR